MEHLWRVVLKLEVVLYIYILKNKVGNKTDRSQGHVQKGLKECLYIRCYVQYLLISCLILHQLLEL